MLASVPGYLQLSGNHYKKHWSIKSHRRLKNLIVVMEYVPDAEQLADLNEEVEEMTSAQLAKFKEVFDVFCVEGQETLQLNELRQLLQALDVNVDQPADVANIRALMAANPDGLTFDTLREMVHSQVFYRLQRGRYWVGLTLEEAETVRSALHIKQGVPLLNAPSEESVAADAELSSLRAEAEAAEQAALEAPDDQELQDKAASADAAAKEAAAKAASVGKSATGAALSTSVSLRLNYTVLDSSEGWTEASEYQTLIATSVLNFIGSEYNFRETEMNMLIRTLSAQGVSCKDREKYFMGVRSCRRRKQIPSSKTPLTALFNVADGYQLLDTRALVIRIKHLIIEKGMLVFDAFRAFNHSRSGSLTCSELYGGLTFLGLELQPSQIHAIVRWMDHDQDGCITFDEFKEAFYDPILELDAAGAKGFGELEEGSEFKVPDDGIPPREMEELAAALETKVKQIEIPDAVIRKCKVKLQPIDRWHELWTSEGTGARSQVGIWRPTSKVDGTRKANSVRVIVGDFAAPSFADPKKADKVNRMILEITDTHSNLGGGASFKGDYIDAVIDRFCPKPIRYKQLWFKLSDGKPALYCWRPVPPNPKFTALGVVFTDSDDTPMPEDLPHRCVPTKWLARAKTGPRIVWEDSGTGGRPGALWTINNMNLISVSKGHDPPTEEMFHELTRA